MKGGVLTARVPLALVLAVACGGLRVEPFGPDTYVASGRSGSTNNQYIAANQANEFCRRQNKVMLPLRWGGTSVGLIFRCVAPDDPEYQRQDQTEVVP